MQSIASLSADDRAQLFQDTTVNLEGIQEPGLIEKDFWVCWVLGRLFRESSPYPTLLFKGGTSLSKGYEVIQRFSEDVDISIDREDLGFGGTRDPLNASSNKQAKKLIKELKTDCATLVQGGLRDTLLDDFRAWLGEPGDSWAVELDSEDPDGQTLLFRYPATRISLPSGAYNRSSVKLEFGARSDHWPAIDRKVTPYAAEAFPDQFPDATTSVRMLALERTFWEKATILHAIAHGGPGKVKSHESRHYYDVAQIAAGPHRDSALGSLDLLEAVAVHKNRFSPSGWARYDLARPSSMKLVPADEVLDVLRPDFQDMRQMFFQGPPDFEGIIKVLSELEKQINSS